MAKRHGQAFLDQHSELFTPMSKPQAGELDRWYSSTNGQETLAAIVCKLWRQMAALADRAMPAHDARHAMVKVSASALQYADAENVNGWARVGLLGALLHDHGRWAEERVLGGPGKGVFHARLSFLLGEEVLREFEMPEPLRQHILLAALRHTAGANKHDPMPLKLSVAADREQLYGPEIVLRLAHYFSADGELGRYYPSAEKPGVRTVMENLASFLVDRLPGPLYTRQAEMAQLGAVSRNFVLAAEDAAHSRHRFQQLARQDTWGRLPRDFNWESAWQQMHSESSANEPTQSAGNTPQEAPQDALLELLRAPCTAPSEGYLQTAVDKLKALSPEQQSRVARGLRYVNAARIRMDVEQASALRTIAAKSDLFTRTLVDLVLPGLEEGTLKVC